MYSEEIKTKDKKIRNLPIVIEIGEFSTKVGFAGDEKPKLIQDTVN